MGDGAKMSEVMKQSREEQELARLTREEAIAKNEAKPKKRKRRMLKPTQAFFQTERDREDMWEKEDTKPMEGITKEESLHKMGVSTPQLPLKINVEKAEDKNYVKMQEMMLHTKHRRMYKIMMRRRLRTHLNNKKIKAKRNRLERKRSNKMTVRDMK